MPESGRDRTWEGMGAGQRASWRRCLFVLAFIVFLGRPAPAGTPALSARSSHAHQAPAYLGGPPERRPGSSLCCSTSLGVVLFLWFVGSLRHGHLASCGGSDPGARTAALAAIGAVRRRSVLVLGGPARSGRSRRDCQHEPGAGRQRCGTLLHRLRAARSRSAAVLSVAVFFGAAKVILQAGVLMPRVGGLCWR